MTSYKYSDLILNESIGQFPSKPVCFLEMLLQGSSDPRTEWCNVLVPPGKGVHPSRSQTDLLVCLYRLWGTRCVQYLPRAVNSSDSWPQVADSLSLSLSLSSASVVNLGNSHTDPSTAKKTPPVARTD